MADAQQWLTEAAFEIPGTDTKVPRWAILGGGAALILILVLSKRRSDAAGVSEDPYYDEETGYGQEGGIYEEFPEIPELPPLPDYGPSPYVDPVYDTPSYSDGGYYAEVTGSTYQPPSLYSYPYAEKYERLEGFLMGDDPSPSVASGIDKQGIWGPSNKEKTIATKTYGTTSTKQTQPVDDYKALASKLLSPTVEKYKTPVTQSKYGATPVTSPTTKTMETKVLGK